MAVPSAVVKPTVIGWVAGAEREMTNEAFLVPALPSEMFTSPTVREGSGASVMVTVLEVDAARKRISLSMKGAGSAKGQGGQRPAGGGGGSQRPTGKPGGGKSAPKEETPDSFQAKLIELKKKFK